MFYSASWLWWQQAIGTTGTKHIDSPIAKKGRLAFVVLWRSLIDCSRSRILNSVDIGARWSMCNIGALQYRIWRVSISLSKRACALEYLGHCRHYYVSGISHTNFQFYRHFAHISVVNITLIMLVKVLEKKLEGTEITSVVNVRS